MKNFNESSNGEYHKALDSSITKTKMNHHIDI